jgi:hypothetical protein
VPSHASGVDRNRPLAITATRDENCQSTSLNFFA